MRSRPEVPLTGRLLVVLSREAVAQLARRASSPHVADFQDLRQLGEELGYSGLAEVVDRWAERTFPVVRSLSTAKILELDRVAREGPFPPSRSMTAYWIAIPSRPTDRHEEAQAMLIAGLLDSPAIETVHLEQAVGAPPVNPTDDDYAGFQVHLDPAPTGIDAAWVWSALGLDGAGIGFTDIERGWNVTHEDLQAKMPAALLTHLNDPSRRNHGTAVLGLTVGVDNDKGIIGIAPGVTAVRLASHWDGGSANNVADAIETAAAVMAPGDVLLLETQAGDDGPIETMDGLAEKDAIMTATSKGIIVIEPAGNAGTFTDTAWPELATDSGAIVVGASDGVGGTVLHPRRTTSNFGKRVDCFATGVDLVSAGYGDLDGGGGNDDREYTNTFRDTSGASAIVAGAAILAQHMHWAACNTRLDSAGMRILLTQNGTKQGAADGNIGIMPDLRKVARGLCDVYVRDYVGDTGVVPSTGPLSSSPDVIVVRAAVADEQDTYGEGSGTENDETLSEAVVANRPHSVYVRVRNRGICRAAGVTATVYYSEVATLVTPGSWKLIGTSGQVTVPAGDALTVTPAIPWVAANVPTSGHYCFVAFVHHPYDPAPPLPSATDWAGFQTFLRRSNNVTWRNFNVVDPAAFSIGAGLWFTMRGFPDELRLYEFEIQARLPGGAPLVLEVPRQLLPALRVGPFTKQLRIEEERVQVALPRFPSIRLPAVRLGKEAYSCRFFVPDEPRWLDGKSGSLLIRQLYEGSEVGRITWVLQSRRRVHRDHG
jgi:serine protease